jgi:hypothetical protein
MRPSVLLSMLSVGLGAVAKPASALELIYRAHEGCPSATAFRELVAARVSGAGQLEPRRLEVTVAVHGGQSHGMLEFDADAATRRHVSDPSCAEVVDALALIAAVALTGEPVAPSLAPISPPAASQPPPDTEAPSDESVLPELGVHLRAATPIAPGATIGPHGFVGLRWHPGGTTSWAARIGVTRLTSGVVSSGPAAARFEWTAAALDACAAFSPATIVEIDGCLTLQAGRLDAEGVRTESIGDTREARSLWLSAGPLGRLRWLPIEVLAIEAAGSVEASFVRRRFHFERPDVEAHETPLFGLFAGLGLAVQLGSKNR